jgi:hypothetical protein
MSQYGTLSPSGMAPTGCLLVWVDLPGEGDGASCRFRQRRPNPREEPGALAALVGIWAGEEQICRDRNCWSGRVVARRALGAELTARGAQPGNCNFLKLVRPRMRSAAGSQPPSAPR